MINSNDPLVLRPSRRRFLVWPSLLALCVLLSLGLLHVTVGVGEAGRGLAVMLFWGGLFGASMLILPGFLGSTLVDAEGVTRRLGRFRRRFAWEEIERISYAPAPMGWAGYWTVLHPRTGRALILSAPVVGARTTEEELAARLEPVYARAGEHRERVSARPADPRVRAVAIGMTVGAMIGVVTQVIAVVLVVSPWEQTWWPGRQEATALPDACSTVDREASARLVPGGKTSARQGASGGDRSCRWEAEGRRLTVRFVMEEPRFIDGNGSVERARERYADLSLEKDYSCWSSFEGEEVGDESCEARERVGEGWRPVRFMARENNVIVMITYRVDGTVEDPGEEMAHMAREVLGKVRFS